MVGHLPFTADLTTVPSPRRPPDATASGDDPVRRWYENELGWPTVPEKSPGSCVRIRVGLRFDVLDIPAAAGHAALRHLTAGSPVAVRGDRLLLLVAAGSAEELPGILEWLEWGALPLDLRALGPGDAMEAPAPPWPPARPDRSLLPEAGRDTTLGAIGCGTADREHDSGPDGRSEGPSPRKAAGDATGPDRLMAAEFSGAGSGAGVRPLVLGRPGALQGAAVWLRPPEPGCEVEASLPTMSALGGVGGPPDLVRVVHTVATQCHRLRLRARP
ncbi:SCO3374 family protein [Streptomyces sp. 351MFTsu5.1]|uniref:SCO3374 family protein n=1 Tax=Streptomyces sp. 351MFTsu5.1 TaxID=1172180 RepID=UPI0003618D15|nr:SCO3374 family protein [Streptomyces sp. 351MFTsu5.1]